MNDDPTPEEVAAETIDHGCGFLVVLGLVAVVVLLILRVAGLV